MSNEISLLVGTAATIGFVHTFFGPDHYLPFIVLAKARQWNIFRTLTITFICGLGHVLSSIILGFIGVVIGDHGLLVVWSRGPSSSKSGISECLGFGHIAISIIFITHICCISHRGVCGIVFPGERLRIRQVVWIGCTVS